MPSDPLEAFSDLRYPGGIAPRRNVEMAEKPEAVDTEWDAKPKIIKRKGVDTEFFTIGDVAKAMGRKQVTIRSWEDKGWLPKTWLRTAKPKRATLEGKKHVGRRLYTREQVEVIIAAANKTGVLSTSVSDPDWKQFTKLVSEGWREIYNTERNT